MIDPAYTNTAMWLIGCWTIALSARTAWREWRDRPAVVFHDRRWRAARSVRRYRDGNGR